MIFELVSFCISQFYVDIVNGFDKKISVVFLFFRSIQVIPKSYFPWAVNSRTQS